MKLKDSYFLIDNRKMYKQLMLCLLNRVTQMSLFLIVTIVPLSGRQYKD
jgi:hypothetical protein